MLVARRAAAAARGAREIITDRRGASEVAEKGVHDFVTATDRAVQKLLFAELAAEFPDFALFGEEGTHSVIDPAVPTWVIDPIDGTTNFVRGHEASVVSVALVHEGESVVGVVYDPYTDRAFVAARGEGAYLGDERLHVSDVDYSEAIMAVGTMPYDKSDSDRLFRMWHRIFLETNDLRRIGAAGRLLRKTPRHMGLCRRIADTHRGRRSIFRLARRARRDGRSKKVCRRCHAAHTRETSSRD